MMIDGTASLPDAVLDRQRDSWLRGSPATVAELLRSSPYEHDREAWLDLVYNEIVIQEELGLEPTLDAYVTRYPDLADDLRLHFEVHNAFRDSSSLLETPNGHQDVSWPDARLTDEADTDSLPDYNLIRVLGHGGMATVYLARHRRLHRDVALKMFKAGRDITERERFRIRTEAEALARLAHPNIVQIYDIGENRGAPYLALEVAEQGTLAQKLQRMPLAPMAAAELIETLARALQAAHERQIVHRDLKPANILFGRNDVPKIADFGLAKVLLDSQVSAVDATRTGETMGTPRYMAPEQAAGETDFVGPATDVYALGNLLYECLTGRAPFVSSSVVETVRMICEDDPLPPRRLQPVIPRDLETICLRCLEKLPSKRYGSALDLAEDLRRFRAQEPILARPTPEWERAVKWCRRHPTQASLLGVGFLSAFLLMLGAIFTAHFEQRRLQTLRGDIAEKMLAGREAVERNDLEQAQSFFQDAWIKVQAEPQLVDHETSVTGWLDHTRNLMNRYQWKQRTPPREFDERRDTALLQSVLVIPDLQNPTQQARQAIQQALEFTIPLDASWQVEREQLTLLDSELIEMEHGPEAALTSLDSTREFSSSTYHRRRAQLLHKLHRDVEAHAALQHGESLPRRKIFERFYAGMNSMRKQEWETALHEFDDVLEAEPEHFAARLFQAIVFLRLQRPSEARIGLTACIAQRPRFVENYYFRAIALYRLHEATAAKRDLDEVLHDRQADAVRYAAQLERGRWELFECNVIGAMSFFSQATVERPDEPSAWRHLGWSQLIAGECSASIDTFEILSNHPTPGSDVRLGIACAQLGLGQTQPIYAWATAVRESITTISLRRFFSLRGNRALSP